MTDKRHDEDVLQAKVLIAMLVARRKALGLTQEAVAKRIGVSQPVVAEFERSCDPRMSTLRRYALAVEASLNPEVVHPAPDEATRRDFAEIFGAIDYGAPT